MIPRELIGLSETDLRALAASLRDGAMKRGVLDSVVHSIVGSASSAVMASLRDLEQSGFGPAQVALLLESVLAERARHARPETLLELVLSGPEVESVPMQDTASVIQSLVRGARREILLVGYAVHDGRTMFRDVAERLDAHAELNVRLCLNVHRGADTSAVQLRVHRFQDEFAKHHWPGTRRPELFYWPASLEPETSERGNLHAKCVVVDRSLALVTSANFTAAAQQRNVELGVLVRHEPIARRIASYFDALIARGTLLRAVSEP